MGKTIFALIGLILAGGIFFMYTKPTYAGPAMGSGVSIGELQAQIQQYEEALEKAAQLQQLKQKLLTRYNSFNPDDINRLQTMIPDHVDNIGLILELDNLASHYGMALENVDVSSDAAAQGQGAAVGAIGGGNQKYESLTLSFGTYGTYEDFLSFLLDLESSLRLVDLVSLTVEQNSDAAQKGERTYHYDIKLKTYWLK